MRADIKPVYIQSRKRGLKRWETHIPPCTGGFMQTAKSQAEAKLAKWSAENPQREYRIFIND